MTEIQHMQNVEVQVIPTIIIVCLEAYHNNPRSMYLDDINGKHSRTEEYSHSGNSTHLAEDTNTPLT